MRERMREELQTLELRRDAATFSHSVRVGLLAEAMAEAGGMPAGEARMLAVACGFHDIGKWLVPYRLLVKRLPLDDAEVAQLREHPLHGERLVRRLGWRDARMIAAIRSHHERWDGSGYPDGLRGNDIPSWARLCAVIDAYDAMVQPRPYNRIKSAADAKAELRRQSGIHFDPDYVDLFLSIPEFTLEKIRRHQTQR